MLSLKKTAIVSLMLLPVFFILHNCNELYGFIHPSEITRSAIIIFSSIIVCFLLLRVFKVSTEKTSLILFFLFFFILFFGPIHDLAKEITFKTVISSYKIFLPAYLLIVFFILLKISKASTINRKNILFLNLVIICLIAAELLMLINNGIKFNKTHNLIYSNKLLCEKYISKYLSDSSKPDIYFFVFDEYTNNKMLKKNWSFNNEEITNWLILNGFFVPGNSTANYSFTPYSLSSIFNMQYLPNEKKIISDPDALHVLQSIESVTDNETFCMLRKEDYDVASFTPIQNFHGKKTIEPFFDYLVADRIYKQTLPGSIDADILWNFKRGQQDQNDTINYESRYRKFKSIQYIIDQIKSSANNHQNRKPQFVYGHLMITHSPHIFDSTGKFLIRPPNPEVSKHNTYPLQILQANRVLRDLITYIDAHNRSNTIIIVEGDHGFREPTGHDGQAYFPNFCAIRFPDKNYSMLYDTISSVNIYRIVFNKYFHQNFPLLKDSEVVVHKMIE